MNVPLFYMVRSRRSPQRSVRRESGTTGTPKAQVSARKRSGNRTAGIGRYVYIDRSVSGELWRVVSSIKSRTPTEGERRETGV
jgi:hypothetical protein